MKEYGKQCGLCRKRRESRQFYRRIDGDWLRLCKECWGKQDSPALEWRLTPPQATVVGLMSKDEGSVVFGGRGGGWCAFPRTGSTWAVPASTVRVLERLGIVEVAQRGLRRHLRLRMAVRQTSPGVFEEVLTPTQAELRFMTDVRRLRQLKGLLAALALEPCAHGDMCPAHGNHGPCAACVARAALHVLEEDGSND